MKKKIYIHTDMEGCSGIDQAEMVPDESLGYPYCCSRLMADLNAAIDGAFLGGASHVTVLDSHHTGKNFDMSKLDPRAEYDPKANKKWWGMLDESYWGSFFIGAHAMAGTINAFLNHTMCPDGIYGYAINGREMGELGIWAMVCGHYNVPMLMVSGDQAGVNEAVQFFSGVETAVVKTATSYTRAKSLPLDDAEEAIRQAAKRAVQKDERPLPFRPLLPMEMKLEFTRADYCDMEMGKEGIERISARCARKISHTYLDFWC